MDGTTINVVWVTFSNPHSVFVYRCNR